MGLRSYGLRIAIIVLLVFGIGKTASAAGTGVLRIATGGKLGTYYAVAKDIQKIAAENGLEIEVLESQGSVHNYEILGFQGGGTGHHAIRCHGIYPGAQTRGPRTISG